MRTLGPPATVVVAGLGGLLAAWRPAVGLAALAAVALGAALWSVVAASRLRPVDVAVATPLLLLPLTPYLAREVDPSLTYLRFALALAVVAGLATRLIPAREGWLRGIGLVIVALALAQVIPAATAPSSGYGALRWVNWIAFVPYAFVRYDRRSLGVALVAAVGGAALLAAGMLAQQRGVLGGAWGGIQLGVGALQPTFQRRYTSFLLEPNHLALFMLSVGIVLYVYAVVAAPGRRRLLAALLGVAICAYCVYVTRSRGALLAIPFVGAFFLVARAMRVFAVTAAIALVAAIVVLPVSPAARGAVDSTWDGVTRILKGEDTSAVLRLTNWRERVDRSGSPVFGAGFGGYAAGTPTDLNDPESRRETVTSLTVDNAWLKLWLEEGALAVLALAAIFAVALRESLRAARTPGQTAIGLALGALLCAVIFRGFSVDLFDINPWNCLIWIVIGMALSRRELAPEPARGPAAV